MSNHVITLNGNSPLTNSGASASPNRLSSQDDFAQVVLDNETLILEDLRVRANLARLVASPGGRRAFACAFYFIRYNFYKLNFIVGARCGPDETFWSGLVHSLYEEVGGSGGKSHNELYRDFLREVGIESEQELKQPDFADQFNQSWERYCATAPFEEALAGVAIFEILDQPDYALLYDVMREAGIGPKGLLFFEVHAKAQHFDFFRGVVSRFWEHESSKESLLKAASFVNSSQNQMWNGLLIHLSEILGERLVSA